MEQVEAVASKNTKVPVSCVPSQILQKDAVALMYHYMPDRCTGCSDLSELWTIHAVSETC